MIQKSGDGPAQIINFHAGGNTVQYQRNMLSQQSSIPTQKVNTQILSHQISSNSNNQTFVADNKKNSQSFGNRSNSKNCQQQKLPSAVKKSGNSSLLLIPQKQQRGSSTNNESNMALNEMGPSGYAQAYESMLHDQHNISNLNDTSVLSGLSHQPFGIQLASHQESIKNINKNVNNSVIIEGSGMAGKKQKKAGIVNGNLMASNTTKFGNYIGNMAATGTLMSNNKSVDNQTLQELQNGLKQKKMSTKMAGNQQAKQLTQDQISFINNFSVDDGNQIPLKVIHQASSASQKQRPHSSFKAQTQKQISTFKNQFINTENAGGAIFLGANGVIGIGTATSAGQNQVNKGAGSRKSKHLQGQSKGKYGLAGTTTQQMNQMSVYQSDLLADHHSRDSRRMTRGSGQSGIGAELSCLSKEESRDTHILENYQFIRSMFRACAFQSYIQKPINFYKASWP